MDAEPNVRPVADDQWDIVAWLWQAFRNDLAVATHAFPYADGRYRHDRLTGYPAPERAGYLLWRPHPNTGDDAPIALALVKGLDERRHALAEFFVVPNARRGGVGRRFALDVIGRHPGAWEVAFQHDNVAAGHFWRAVARDAWGDAWVEERVPLAGKPDLPADHWIRSTGRP